MASDPYSGAPNPGAPQKSSNTKVILIIAAVVVVVGGIPCLGIMAAIAIPAFLRYTKKSKTAEAAVVLNQMSNKAAMHVIETCELPPPLPAHSDLAMCSGGAKCLPSGEIPDFWKGIGLEDPTYFVYSATIEGDQMVFVAQADFNVGTQAVHTEEIRLTKVECDSETSPQITINEFE